MTQSLKPSMRLITELRLAEQAALLGRHEARAWTPPRRPRASGATRWRSPPACSWRVSSAMSADLALEALAQVGPQPGMRLQLERVGRLVQADPEPEVIERDARRAGGRTRMFSSTNSSRPGASSADSSAMSYWPSTRVPR